jgi:hypothetical protein
MRCICTEHSFWIIPGQHVIGNPKIAGMAVYNAADQSYNLKGGGYNIWFERDEWFLLYFLQR